MENIIKDENIINENLTQTINTNWNNVGYVQSLSDGVALVIGLTELAAGEFVTFNTGIKNEVVTGITLTLKKGKALIGIFGNERLIGQGTAVTKQHRLVGVPTSKVLLGRVIDPLGNPVDTYDFKPLNISGETLYAIDVKAPGIITRQTVNQPLQTGIFSIDTMIPIGLGQRELIIGDRQTGKTTIAFDTIYNQKTLHDNKASNRVYCIYVAIGQKRAAVAHFVELLKKVEALSYTVIVAATASESAALQYLAAYSGATIGERYRNNGRHALIVYDDLSKQAVAYRQMSLLIRRPPGRDAYPGDVFYLHSRLLERASKLKDSLGGGSLTALPIIETQEGDVSAYIPTNVISITDGQIFLSKKFFTQGIIPALNVGISVSRIGSGCQRLAMKAISSSLKLEYAQYNDMEGFLSFASDIDADSLQILSRGQRLVELLKQQRYNPLPEICQIVLAFAILNGYCDSFPLSMMKNVRNTLIALGNNYEKLGFTIDLNEKLSTDDLHKLLKTHFRQYNN